MWLWWAAVFSLLAIGSGKVEDSSVISDDDVREFNEDSNVEFERQKKITNEKARGLMLTPSNSAAIRLGV
ncbi:hypothetical protein Y032_0039g102 [Ancylostoma ceylanicum]|uniref:Uncharacterized protein n=1 Tax=Ancylostoma ceylanicum TaxID=53326 RepID=A0A016UJF6_9BILA|nr:hypothetical protein Y032_0039g102 [Ancylostoma ceylanicum]